jgi:nucleoside-diphosphate-sugar epimerase
MSSRKLGASVLEDNYGGFYRGRKVLVTGGHGFIGLNLGQRLLDLGGDVTLLDNFVPSELAGILVEGQGRLKTVVADIRDEDKVERVVRDQEILFNLAGKSGAADSNKAPALDLDINCRGHLTLLDACRRVNPTVTVVFPSSRLVYGKPRYLPVDENHPLAPESIYAAHKLAAESYHLIYGRLYGLKSTVLRISNPYGPMQAGDARVYGIANTFIRTAVQGGDITLFGDGAQQRDYIYIDDLVDAFLKAAASETSRDRIYNVGDGRSVSLRELAELSVRIAGRGDIVYVPWPAEYQTIESGDYVTNCGLIRDQLGWLPFTSLEAGIEKTVSYYRK